jgi:alkylation response protein AidB-like acyl-CoA dehydrogenase
MGAELSEFRAELQDWIASNAPDALSDLFDWRNRAIDGGHREEEMEELRAGPLYQQWSDRFLEANLICPAWPIENGGRGWDEVRMAIFDEECYCAGVPRVDRGQGESMVGPSIVLHGTAEQKAAFLPPIISGEHTYCQGFSEPDYGSDLAGAQCRGVVNGDHIAITGQKVWTSRYRRANMIFVLCRTNPTAPKHRGLSYVLVEFAPSNGIDVRPVRQMTGAAEFCEDFFDGAKAPLFNVIGGIDNGWQVAQSTLAFERGGGSRSTMNFLARWREFEQLLDLVRQTGRADDPLVRQQVADAYTQLELLRFNRRLVFASMAEGGDPGPEATAWKLMWSQYHTKVTELALEIAGSAALVRPEGDDYATDYWQDAFLAARAGLIYAGTSEIQKNIIAERVLGLPRERLG